MKAKGESEVPQSSLTLWDPVDCSLPGSCIHGILQARILDWVAIAFSRGSSWSRDRTQVSHIVGRCFTLWATREAQLNGRARCKSGQCVFRVTWSWCLLCMGKPAQERQDPIALSPITDDSVANHRTVEQSQLFKKKFFLLVYPFVFHLFIYWFIFNFFGCTAWHVGC